MQKVRSALQLKDKKIYWLPAESDSDRKAGKNSADTGHRGISGVFSDRGDLSLLQNTYKNQTKTCYFRTALHSMLFLRLSGNAAEEREEKRRK